MQRVCVIGCGAIGSLYAGHLARVARVWALVRRPEHADALRREGLRISGAHEFHVRFEATHRVEDLPGFDLGIVATKATQTETAFAPTGRLFDQGAVISAQNGLGGEEILARHTEGKVIRATTFMSGTRHSDTHVQFELDTPTWMGPFEPGGTPYEVVRRAADLIVKAGLKAEALPDARPAQWSKLIFNASVNAVSALTRLPHCRHFADREQFSSLGNLVHDLIEEGRLVAEAAGVRLHEDPWKMNLVGAETDHPPSMLSDILQQRPTEIEFLCGALAREARAAGVEAPLHTAMYRLIKGLEESSPGDSWPK